MSEVKRYTHSWKHNIPQMVECDYGDWIKLDDYTALQAENDNKANRLNSLKAKHSDDERTFNGIINNLKAENERLRNPLRYA